MNKIKVLFTFYALPPYLIALLNQISQSGINILVVTPENSQITQGKNVYQDYSNAKFEIQKVPHKKHWLSQKEYLIGLDEIIKNFNPNYLVTCWPYVIQVAFNFSLRKYMKKKGIQWGLKHIPYQIPKYHEAMKYYTEIGIFDEELNVEKAIGWKKKIKFFLLKELNKFLFNSVKFHFCYISEAPEILKTYGVNPQNVIVTYNSGDTPKLLAAYQWALNQPNEPKEKFTFILVGRLVKWKKVHILIEVFSELCLKYNNIQLLIVGAGPELENLKLLTQNLSLQEKIMFEGGIYDYNLLAQKFKNSDVFVLTGAGGLAINDAMTFAKPVICTYADGTEKDLVIPNQTGFIYQNAKELKNYMEFFINNPHKAQEMGKNAQLKILNEINLEKVSQKYVDYFLKVKNIAD